jgi:hypothetical protein
MSMSTDNGGTVNRQIINHAVRGRDRLIQAYHGISKEWVEKKLLSRGQQCSASSKAICYHNKLLAFQSLFSTTDGDMDDLTTWEDTELQICKPCLDLLEVAYDKAREDLWNRLPSFFGLSPWEELKDFDAAYTPSDK